MDKELLEIPYPRGTDAEAARLILMNTLGLACPNLRRLSSEIFADFNTEHLGIGWWAAYTALGDRRRIFVSDYLYQLAEGIEANLLDAKVHLYELLDFWEHDNAKKASILKLHRSGKFTADLPTPMSPADDVAQAVEGIHVGGFFRAVGSSLDCLGGMVVGVAGLPINIKTADFGKALKHLRAVGSAENSLTLLKKLLSSLESAIQTSGPEGWLGWANDTRNTFVHRARRLNMISLEPVPVESPSGIKLYDSRGVPMVRTKMNRLMPATPTLSDVEMWANDDLAHCLTEQSATTLTGISKSVVSLIDAVAADLVDLWRKRSADPGLIVQPPRQWSLERTFVSTFKGYSPGDCDYSPKVAKTSPRIVRRMIVAALDGPNRRARWAKFT